MKYLLLIYSDHRIIEAMSPDEIETLKAEYLALMDEMVSGGHFQAGESLQPVRTATTLRVRDGKVTATDGPFAETREQLGGFFLIEARDLNEAMRLAAKIPGARWGCVEVRPINELPRTARP